MTNLERLRNELNKVRQEIKNGIDIKRNRQRERYLTDRINEELAK